MIKYIIICSFIFFVVACASILPKKNSIPKNKKLVGQYIKCKCETKYFPFNQGIRPATLLELYSDSSFVLAGDFEYYHSLGCLPEVISCFKGSYTIPNDTIILLSIKSRQMLFYTEIPNLTIWKTVMNFYYLDAQRRVILFTNAQKTEVNLYMLNGGFLKEEPGRGDTITMEPVTYLPKPFFKGNELIDTSFYSKVTKHCRDSFPLRPKKTGNIFGDRH
jgi:hypothetical protein